MKVRIFGLGRTGLGTARDLVRSDADLVVFDGYNSSQPYIGSGKTRVVAVASAERIDPLPNVPTFKGQGIDYTNSLWLGLMAPAGTPREAVDRLSEALAFALSSPDLRRRFHAEGSDTTFMTPGRFSEFIVSDAARMRDVASALSLSQ